MGTGKSGKVSHDDFLTLFRRVQPLPALQHSVWLDGVSIEMTQRLKFEVITTGRLIGSRYWLEAADELHGWDWLDGNFRLHAYGSREGLGTKPSQHR